MDINQLVRMANSIGDYFVAYPNRAEAEVSIATHIRMNWTPAMRAQLYAHANAAAAPDESSGLRPIVGAAIRNHPQFFRRSELADGTV